MSEIYKIHNVTIFGKPDLQTKSASSINEDALGKPAVCQEPNCGEPLLDCPATGSTCCPKCSTPHVHNWVEVNESKMKDPGSFIHQVHFYAGEFFNWLSKELQDNDYLVKMVKLTPETKMVSTQNGYQFHNGILALKILPLMELSPCVTIINNAVDLELWELFHSKFNKWKYSLV